MNKLSLFFKSINKYGLYFIEKTKKPFEEYNAEIKKCVHSSSIIIAYNEFKNSTNKFFDDLKLLLEKFNSELSEPLDLFLNELNNKNNEFLTDLNRLNTIVQDNKLKVEKSKNNYFNASKEASEQEQKINKLKESKTTKEETLKYQNELLTKYKNNSINAEQIYKKDLKNLNKCLEEGEEKYQIILDNLENEETSRLKYFTTITDNYSNLIKENSVIKNNYADKVKKLGNNINLKRDIKIYNNSLDFKNENKIRFPIEQFLNYEIFKKSDLKEKNKLSFLQLEPSEKIVGSGKNKSLDNLEIIQIQNEEIKNKDQTLEKNVEKLMNEEQILINDDLTYIINQIELNKNNSILFIKYLSIFYKDNCFVKIKSLDNLHHLSNLLSIIINNTKTLKEILYLNFIIIYIAEKTVYLNPDNIFNKCYLTKLLSKNKIFSQKNFWIELLDLKISYVADFKVKKELEKKNSNNENSSVFFSIKNIFGGGKIKENKKIENEIVYRQLYEKKLPIYTVEVLEDFIQHFSNFNFDVSQSIELINEFSSKYKFDNSYVNYFMAELNSNTYTIKNQNDSLIDIEKKIDYQTLFFNTDNLKNKVFSDNKLKSLLYSIKYMNIKELPNIISLNKLYNEKLKRFIYKNILLKYHDMSIENHIKIWKLLLNYNKLKEKYDYKKIKEEIEKNPNLVESKEIINLDVIRTYFKKDRQLNREKTSNILKVACKETPSINYCQGMNYIVAFLLSITEDEEDSFYLFLSLLIYTDYGSLFSEDLEKLKKYFYVFERLINIFLPELYSYFLDNNINVSYFISPWFITLFTDAFPHISNLSEPKIIMRIWDLFIFNGWNSIIKIGISIIKHFESKLLNLTFETLLRFLINDIIKSDFFENESFDNLTFITYNFKIEAGLIKNLENEYEIKKKMNPIGD